MSKFVFLKSLRELLVPLKHLIDKKAENVNWNENDPAAKGYIANRTHYKAVEKKIFLNNKKLNFYDEDFAYIAEFSPALEFNIGDSVTVIWDGKEYNLKAYALEGVAIGNSSIVPFFPNSADTGEPFLIISNSNYGYCMVATQETGSHTITIFGDVTVVHKIPSEYLPEISSVGKESTGEGAEIFNDYENNVAEGKYSHAEGSDTVAYGTYSHTEGLRTEANFCSHAEGQGSRATGENCHAEGLNSQSSGYASHAEGSYTEATSDWCHAEGNWTIASSPAQHVQGKFNIEDSTSKYAHIVGNGLNGTDLRRNAHTLDWNGLGWFAGGLKVGGTGQDDANAKNVATESYVNEKIAAIPMPDVSGQIAAPKDGIVFIDQINGFHYVACMREGNFITYCAIKFIEAVTMPVKTEYMAGDYFDPTGMTIIATTYDGTTKEITDFIYPNTYLIDGTTSVEISYIEGGISHTIIIPVTVNEFDPITVLVDFEYTANDDGTYTITGWKGTLNGEANTEMIIPNNGLIIV